jgi:DNA polymerase delta subunit 3
VYSLQPTVLQDLNVLTDASRELSTTYANEDPLEYGKQWGMIQNSHVKVLDLLVLSAQELC